MSEERTEAQRERIVAAREKGGLATLGAYARLSGPGWLQSAITLGGGSLAGSLYLGVLGGFSLLWLQPLAMVMGVIMLSAISTVTLSTGERPFGAINRHVNPVMGWSWAIASMMANLVWALPQFALGTAAVTQNLAPGIGDGTGSKAGLVVALFVAASIVVLLYDRGTRGVRGFEIVLKCMVGIIVLCFFGVVIKMSTSGALDWGAIGQGFIPDLSLLSAPAATFEPYLEALGPEARERWTATIVSQQRDVMITAAATAVGINMTFLLPYSMLRRGWGKDFRGLAIFDLATGLFVPFVLATACVVIASSTQFHTTPDPDVLAALEEKAAADPANAMPPEERTLAAMLEKRDAFELAQALEPLTGSTISQYVFGVGVLGMALSTIILLMLINGFVICEMLGIEQKGWPYRLACLAPGLTGALGPFVWSGAKFWLAVPTSVFGMVLLPIAYFSFFLLFNQRSLMGEHMPTGARRWVWNVLMAVAAGLASFGALWVIWSKTGWIGMGGLGVLLALAAVVHVVRPKAG